MKLMRDRQTLRSRRCWRWLAAVGLVVLVGAVIRPGIHTEAQDLSPYEPVTEPTVVLSVPQGTIRTPHAVAKAEAALSVSPGAFVKRFLHTMSEGEYQEAKAATATLAISRPEHPDAGAPGGPLAPPTQIITNIEGVNQTAAGGWRPPDTHGAIGATQFVEVTNSHLDVYNKTSPFSLVNSVTLASFFGYTTKEIFDPRVVYDSAWNRWVIYAEAFAESSTVQYIFIAASTTSSATGSFCGYKLDVNINNNDDFWDFGQLGMDQDAVIITANIFGATTYRGARLLSVAKAQLYNCSKLSIPIFSGLAGTLAPPTVLDQNAKTFLVAAPPSGSAITK